MAKDLKILIVDDEPHHADGLVESLQNTGAQVAAAYGVSEALEIIGKGDVDIVITDLKMPEGNGLDLLDAAKAQNPASEVILMTAYATVENCKEALRSGALDYLVKPIDLDQLRKVVNEAIAKVSKGTDADSSASGHVHLKEFVFEGVKGEDASMQKVFEVLRRVAPSNISVLIEGASGTGKELLARAIHQNSLRKDQAFKPINCAGLAETLLESELFGHAKGAFTGAVGERKGLFELADKGTLFLDEIGDMPLNMQAKLLRVLEDGVVVPVGSHKSVVVDVRVISATNHDLTKLIEEKKFRQDLYFRIKGVSVTLPPLKERRGDIDALVEFFIREASQETGLPVKSVTESAMSMLRGYEWPGNVRQLRNAVRTMVVLCERDKIDVQDLPPEVRAVRQLGPGDSVGASSKGLGGMSLDELEKQAIIETLAKTNNNREAAAKILGIGERTLYRKIKEYGI